MPFYLKFVNVFSLKHYRKTSNWPGIWYYKFRFDVCRRFEYRQISGGASIPLPHLCASLCLAGNISSFETSLVCVLLNVCNVTVFDCFAVVTAVFVPIFRYSRDHRTCAGAWIPTSATENRTISTRRCTTRLRTAWNICSGDSWVCGGVYRVYVFWREMWVCLSSVD